MVEPFLVIEQLSLRKSGHSILQNIDLSFYPGEIHVLLGLNGSGKSSLAYTMMGCEGYDPASGRILMDGKDITRASITERARMGITLAWQEPVRFEGLPIGKYIGLGAGEPNQEKVVTALEAVSLPVKTYGYRSTDQTLSGGERKRVELAAVYAMQSRLAILDEPDFRNRRTLDYRCGQSHSTDGAERQRRAINYPPPRAGRSGKYSFPDVPRFAGFYRQSRGSQLILSRTLPTPPEYPGSTALVARNPS